MFLQTCLGLAAGQRVKELAGVIQSLLSSHQVSSNLCYPPPQPLISRKKGVCCSQAVSFKGLEESFCRRLLDPQIHLWQLEKCLYGWPNSRQGVFLPPGGFPASHLPLPVSSKFCLNVFLFFQISQTTIEVSFEGRISLSSEAKVFLNPPGCALTAVLSVAGSQG